MTQQQDLGEDIDRWILEYLDRKGYKNTMNALKEEGKVDSMEELTQQALPDIQKAVSRRVSGVYANSYSQLRDWIHESSLDMYKHELLAVLYPMFVHCYLQLVRKGQSEEANSFMTQFVEEHEQLHKSETVELKGLKTNAHVNESKLCEAYLEHKFDVLLCSYSFELLVNFLQDSKMMALLSIFNSHINLKVVGEQPTTTPCTASIAVGSDVEKLNSTTIAWQPLRDITEMHKKIAEALEHKEAEREAQRKATENGGEGDKDADKPESEKRRKKAKKEKESPSMESKIPIPPFHDRTEKKILQESKKRVSVSATHLPSAFLLTYLHSKNTVNSINFSNDSSMVACASSDSTVSITRLRNLAAVAAQQAQQQESTDKALEEKAANATTRFAGHGGPVYGTSFSRDDRFVMSCSQDGTARLWSLETQTCLVSYKGHGYPVWDVCFGPLGYYFATCSYDRTARIWSCDKMHPLRIMSGHISDVRCCIFHPNCNYLATGSDDKTVRLWEVASGECVRNFAGHHGAITALSISPDGRVCASGADDATVMLWDLASGKRMGLLKGHSKSIWSLDFSAEGSLLVSGGGDNSIRFWDMEADLEDPEPVSTYFTKNIPVYSAQFSRRNLLMAAGPFVK